MAWKILHDAPWIRRRPQNVPLLVSGTRSPSTPERFSFKGPFSLPRKSSLHSTASAPCIGSACLDILDPTHFLTLYIYIRSTRLVSSATLLPSMMWLPMAFSRSSRDQTRRQQPSPPCFVCSWRTRSPTVDFRQRSTSTIPEERIPVQPPIMVT